MEYLKISNKGELDIRLVELMGGTTKSKDKYKIGQFGTGLKYTLSWLIRNNLVFELWIGDKKVDIETKDETIRNEQFQIVYINGNRTSLTTSMGQEWEAWMIVREIWCNALDEEDNKNEVVRETEGRKGYTTFFIQNTGDIKEVVENWKDYFLHDIEPLQDHTDFAVYNRIGKGMRLYKNGVLIHKDETKDNTVFSYDIKTAQINEMREYRGAARNDVPDIIARLDKKNAIYFLDNVEESYEKEYEYDNFWNKSFTQEWREAIGNAKLIDRSSYNNLKERGIINQENSASYVPLPKSLFKALTSKFEGVSAVRTADKVNSFLEIPNDETEEILKQKIEEGLKLLSARGYNISEDLKFKYGVFGDKRIVAQIHREDKEILIGERLSSMNAADVAATIIEENEHYVTGLGDCSREFQQHFIDLYTSELIKDKEVQTLEDFIAYCKFRDVIPKNFTWEQIVSDFKEK